ncbi:cysteine-rich CWC family protein [Leptothrix sp. BB-4]
MTANLPLQPLPDRCPRCGGPFRCGIDDPGPCACTRITLDAATLAQLRARWTGCLCLDCLADLAASGGTTAHPASTEPR